MKIFFSHIAPREYSVDNENELKTAIPAAMKQGDSIRFRDVNDKLVIVNPVSVSLIEFDDGDTINGDIAETLSEIRAVHGEMTPPIAPGPGTAELAD